MDALSARLANLKSLVAALTANGRPQRNAAIDLNLSPSYLSQLVGGKKMGDDVARKIEATRGLPNGWMDQVHRTGAEERSADYLVSQPTRIQAETIAAALKLLRLCFANLDLEFNNEEDGIPLAYAYEYLAQRGERIVTPDNVIDFSKRLTARLKELEDDGTRDRVAGSAGTGNRRAG